MPNDALELLRLLMQEPHCYDDTFDETPTPRRAGTVRMQTTLAVFGAHLEAFLDSVERTGEPLRLVSDDRPPLVIVPHDLMGRALSGEQPGPDECSWSCRLLAARGGRQDFALIAGLD
jgi:hypothetical protein